MALENLFFRHNFNARNDPKLINIRRNIGVDGIGIYWMLLEFSYERNGYFNNEELKNFCWQERLDLEQVKKVMEYSEFTTNDKGEYFLNGVIKRIEKREEYSKKQSANANKRWGKTTEKHVVPVPEWYEKHQKQEEEQQRKRKEEQAINEEAIKKMPERYMELLTKGVSNSISKKEEQELEEYEKQLDKIKKELKEKKNPFKD